MSLGGTMSGKSKTETTHGSRRRDIIRRVWSGNVKNMWLVKYMGKGWKILNEKTVLNKTTNYIEILIRIIDRYNIGRSF